MFSDFFVSNAVNGNYRVTDSGFDYEKSLNKLCKNVLTVSIENDFFASKNTVENLYGKFNFESNIKHLHLTEKETGISPLNHFSWAKKPEYFTELIEKWINENIIGSVADCL